MREIRLCPAEISDSCVQFPAFSPRTDFLSGRDRRDTGLSLSVLAYGYEGYQDSLLARVPTNKDCPFERRLVLAVKQRCRHRQKKAKKTKAALSMHMVSAQTEPFPRASA